MARLTERSSFKVGDFIGLARELGAEGFFERYPHPFLHVIMSEIHEEDAEFFTEAVGEDSLAELKMSVSVRTVDPGSVVVPVVKRWGANPFADMVTVGRAKNCDIVFHSPKISKFHCFIRGQGDGSVGFALADAGSRNGTKFNGQRLPKKRSVALNSGDRIDLGDVLALNFYSAAGFYGLLK